MVNRIAFLVIVLAALIWLAASLDVSERPPHKESAAGLSAAAARDPEMTYQSIPNAPVTLHALHPLAVAALQLLISIGVLVAASPSREAAVNTGKTA